MGLGSVGDWDRPLGRAGAVLLVFVLALSLAAVSVPAWSSEPAPPLAAGLSYPLDQEHRLIIRPPGLEEELRALEWTIDRLPFFKRKGYTVALPDQPDFMAWLKDRKTRAGNRGELARIFGDKVFDPAAYGPGLQALALRPEMVVRAFSGLKRLAERWGFQLFPSYEVVLTLYGPGGSYDPRSGRISLLTTTRGRFKQSDPLQTIVHEMVHLGLERPVVKRFGLGHWEKERLVDLICLVFLKQTLPGYKPGTRACPELDRLVSLKGLDDLPRAVAAYVGATPRSRKEQGCGPYGSGRVVVVEILPGSQAQARGFKKGDTIAAYNGRPVDRPGRLAELVQEAQGQDRILVRILREGRILELEVQGGSLGLRIGWD